MFHPPSPLFGHKQFEAARALISEIEVEAQERELGLYPVTTTDQAVDLLLERLAA